MSEKESRNGANNKTTVTYTPFRKRPLAEGLGVGVAVVACWRLFASAGSCGEELHIFGGRGSVLLLVLVSLSYALQLWLSLWLSEAAAAVYQ